MAIAMPHHRFTTEDYEQMIVTGILDEDDCVELIDGEIITTSPIDRFTLTPSRYSIVCCHG